MINRSEILQTIAMIDQQHLDIRTITMGISLLDCADTDIERSCTKVYDKICRLAGDLVRGAVERFGIRHIGLRARARSDEGDGRDGHALIDDGDAVSATTSNGWPCTLCSACCTTPGPDTPTCTSHSGSPTP